MITIDNPYSAQEYTQMYSNGYPVYAYSKYHCTELLAAIKGAGWNTPAVMLYLAYRRYSNRLNRQIKALWQRAK